MSGCEPFYATDCTCHLVTYCLIKQFDWGFLVFIRDAQMEDIHPKNFFQMVLGKVYLVLTFLRRGFVQSWRFSKVVFAFIFLINFFLGKTVRRFEENFL